MEARNTEVDNRIVLPRQRGRVTFIVMKHRNPEIGICSHCKDSFQLKGGLIPTHDFPKPCRSVCPGSKGLPEGSKDAKCPVSGCNNPAGKGTMLGMCLACEEDFNQLRDYNEMC